jgi:hypothetical protein
MLSDILNLYRQPPVANSASLGSCQHSSDLNSSKRSREDQYSSSSTHQEDTEGWFYSQSATVFVIISDSLHSAPQQTEYGLPDVNDAPQRTSHAQKVNERIEGVNLLYRSRRHQTATRKALKKFRERILMICRCSFPFSCSSLLPTSNGAS